jgi:hypothetical protein
MASGLIGSRAVSIAGVAVVALVSGVIGVIGVNGNAAIPGVEDSIVSSCESCGCCL